MAITIGGIDVCFTESSHDLLNMWCPFGTETTLLKKGWQKEPGRKAMLVDVIWEKDVPIRLRDDTLLRGDVFRPADSDQQKVPAILPWSPFGKTGTGGLSLDKLPWRIGVPKDATTGLEKWEAPDPSEWCARGYAVVNVDPRGTFNSEGNFYVYGTQEGRDGYDTIEWIAAQSWCTGAVGLAGNSWLGTTQWFIAAEQPPHLKAIAPWEGLGDYYRESICRGGIPDHSFWDWLLALIGGQNQREDVSTMVEKYPLWNAYWDDKRPQLSKINIPMYALASYSTALHTEGSLRGFFLSATTEKWLRIHPTQEWHDQYQPENLDELQQFFDRYLKGLDNGWEKTPRLRLSLLGYNRPNVINRQVDSYPPPNFDFVTFYLDAATKTLSLTPAEETKTAKYNAQDPGDDGYHFTYRFDSYTELCGFSRAKVFMSCQDHDDMDVYVIIRKLDKSGKPLINFNIPFETLAEGTTPADIPHENVWKYVGPNGRLRASHRAHALEPGLTDDQRKLLSEGYVWNPHDREEKVPKGQVVELDIGLWAGGIVFDPGESMRLEIKGHHPTVPEWEDVAKNIPNYNVGWHTVHTGKEFLSTLRVALSRS